MRAESQFVGRNGIVRTVRAHSSENRQSEQRNRHRTFQLLRAVGHNHHSPLLRWQRTYEPITDQWIGASSVFDALVSMATFRLNEDEAQEATIIDSSGVSYKARSIYHPFLGEKAVRNNFDIQNHEYIHYNGGEHGRQEYLPAKRWA